MNFANQILSSISVVFVTFFAADKARVLTGVIEVEVEDNPLLWERINRKEGQEDNCDRLRWTLLDENEVLTLTYFRPFLQHFLLLPAAGTITF